MVDMATGMQNEIFQNEANCCPFIRMGINRRKELLLQSALAQAAICRSHGQEINQNNGAQAQRNNTAELWGFLLRRFGHVANGTITANDAHHWRRARNGHHETEAESRRPVHEPCVRLT